MCLTVDENVKIDFNENGEFTAYKCLVSHGGKVCTAVILHEITFDIIEVSQHVSIYGPPHMFLKNGSEVDDFAIHVLLNREDAERYNECLKKFREYYGDNRFVYHVVPCLVKKEDLIACGTAQLASRDGVEFTTFKSAAFRKVKLLQFGSHVA